MGDVYGGRERLESPGRAVANHARRAAADDPAPTPETVIGIYGSIGEAMRAVRPSEVDDEALQAALETLRARWRRERDAQRALSAAPAPAPRAAAAEAEETSEVADPVVQMALHSLRAHARRRQEKALAPGAPVADAPELDVPFASGVAELEADIEITDSIPLVRPQKAPPAPPPRAPEGDEDGWSWTDQRDSRREPEPSTAAQSFCARLARRAAEFRARIGPDRELGVRLSPVFGEPLYVEDIAHDGPDMLVLRGSTKLGVQVEVMQHVGQANVWFVAMSPRKER
jgi:hypothetical protein